VGHSTPTTHATVVRVRGGGRRRRVHRRRSAIAVHAFYKVPSKGRELVNEDVRSNRDRIHTLHTVIIAIVPVVVPRPVHGSGGRVPVCGSGHVVIYGAGASHIHILIVVHHGGRRSIGDGGPIWSPYSRFIIRAVGKRR
jgi:hypothetical protein